MQKFTATLALLSVLICSGAPVTALAQAYQPQGYQPYGYQAPPGMYPQPFRNGRGAGQRQPYWSPYQQPQQERFQAPRIEVSVSDTAPFEQQSLVYKIRVVSSGSLKRISPELPQTASVVLRRLEDPITTRSSGRGQESVTEYRYLLMPLSSGVIEIPPARVTGVHVTRSGTDGPPFEAVARGPVVLQVQPAAEAVQPWLPLQDLRVAAQILDANAAVAGNPIKLEIETTAVGATGSQIPSFASQLESENFRIYPGNSVTEGSLSPDGRTLRGRRVETFTLVPQYGGWLKIPSLRINWWNVRYNRPEVAAVAMRQLHVSGPSNPDGAAGGADDGTFLPSGGSIFFWLPLMVALGVALYGWLSAAFMGTGRLPGVAAVTKFLKPILGELYAPVAAFAARFSPRRHFHRLRAWTGRTLPVSWKLWFCLRAVAREDDPTEWGQALQILAAKHLGVRPQAHLKYLGESIAACHPRADPQQVERLMGELDQAVYGDTPIKSFARWKREFESQIKPSLFPIRFRHCRVMSSARSRKLPQLNPG